MGRGSVMELVRQWRPLSLPLPAVLGVVVLAGEWTGVRRAEAEAAALGGVGAAVGA